MDQSVFCLLSFIVYIPGKDTEYSAVRGEFWGRYETAALYARIGPLSIQKLAIGPVNEA
jgi:hypothetical protein